ncbi:phage baseplate assembly protein [Cupriavidus respiraculi]|uniref:Baseplate protein n=1 Tax=Cupriavidus respiraculi TaxID=195930 RepID=A0ABN7YJR8_9BURK|nr:baseplate protein [Cupriavidus respiraculi]CAG9172380.1 hypothetical protein LMG21510_01955 [Cupriavidus respiraculi]
MTENINAVKLRVNGTDYGGWKEVEITAGIERQVRDFTLAVTDRWPGQTDVPRRIRPGDVCEVFIGSDRVLTGYVDATPIRYDGRQVSVGVKGRSKTQDLVDCAAMHKPGSWSGATVERIARDLASTYGIKVTSEVEPGKPLSHVIEQGETVFESIDRLLRLRQLLATDDAEGRLVFIHVGSAGSAATALRHGENILGADASLDYKEVFSEYICKGQRAGNDEDFGAAVAEESAVITDATVRRRRVMLIKASGQADGGTAADRVKYERANRRAKAIATTYTVQGWRQADGSLWRHNQLVRVTDPVIGFDDQFVIAQITYRLSDQGMVSLLQVGPPDGYVNNPAKGAAKKDAKDKKVAEWGDVRPADSRAPKVNNSAPKTKGGGWSEVKGAR